MGFRLKSGLIIVLLVIFSAGLSGAQSKVLTQEKQIEAAVTPAPEELRGNAAVKGYNEDGELITLRDGSNKLVCLADDPQQDNFHVACYHKDLEPFMQRGRELKARGLSRKKVDSLRREEIKAGKIEMPGKPMALYSLTGPKDAFNYDTGTVEKASPLYVIYTPYATEESTGLSKDPISKGAPWLMEPGTPWAHIMVMTGRDIGNSIGNEK